MLMREVIAQQRDRAVRRLVGVCDAFLLFGDETADRLRVKHALALKITVEAATRHPGACHDFVDGGRGETVAIEKLQRALNDFLAHLLAMMSLSHVRPDRCICSCASIDKDRSSRLNIP